MKKVRKESAARGGGVRQQLLSSPTSVFLRGMPKTCMKAKVDRPGLILSSDWRLSCVDLVLW